MHIISKDSLPKYYHNNKERLQKLAVKNSKALKGKS